MQLLPSIIDSPVSDGRATLHHEPAKLTFRKEEYDIVEHYYQDNSTGYRFTNDAVDALNIIQVHNQYRTQHGIPFPEQISALREQYSLSAAKMSLLLDFGPNQFRKYEEGEMPSDSNASHMLLARDPRVFQQLVERKKHLLPASEYTRLSHRVRDLLLPQTAPWDCADSNEGFLTHALINPNAIPNEFNGFTPPNPEKFAQMVLYLFWHHDWLYQVRLNKLLFYIDFLHYRCTGRSISGYRYQAIHHGPVICNYELHLGLLVKHGVLNREIDSVNKRRDDGGPLFKYSAARATNDAILSESEWAAIKLVSSQLGYKKTGEIEKLSHDERAWLDNYQNHASISYQTYAFDLRAIAP